MDERALQARTYVASAMAALPQDHPAWMPLAAAYVALGGVQWRKRGLGSGRGTGGADDDPGAIEPPGNLTTGEAQAWRDGRDAIILKALADRTEEMRYD